jgi:hypothetical protein
MITDSNQASFIKIVVRRLKEGVNEITVHQFFKKRDAHFWQLHLQTRSGKLILVVKITN